MKKIYLCIFLTLPILAFAQSPCDQTNIRLESQSDVDSFPSNGCSTVCILTIQGNDITNLDSLYVLQKAGVVNISYNPLLADVGGLRNLTAIEPTCTFGGLYIQGNNVLTNLDGLSGLTSVNGTILILSNTMLSDIDGLSNVTTANGDVHVESNATLDNIDGLRGLTSIGRDLIIKGNPPLDEVDGLSHLTEVAGAVDFEYNDGLVSIAGLSSLERIGGSLTFVWNTELTNFRPLSNLNHIGQFNASGQSLLIGSNNKLTSLDGLQSLDTIPGVLMIGDNEALLNLDGLSNVRTLDSGPGGSYNSGINISGNKSLTDISGLAGIRSITAGRSGYLSIYDNDALTTIDSLSFVTIGGSLSGSVEISYNDNLRNIDGLASLTTISSGLGASLKITDNPRLQNIDALSNFSKLSSSRGGTLTITNNTDLGRFCGLYTLFHTKGIGCGSPDCYSTAQVTIDGNERNPTPEEIEAEGPCDALASQPTNLVFSQVTSEGMRGRFSRSGTFASGYLVLMKAYGPSAPEDTPQDGTTYRVGQVIGSSSIVVSAGMDTTFVISGLMPSTPYYFDVFSWKVTENGNDYLTVNPLEGNQSTTAQGVPANNLSFTDVTDESMTVSLDNAQPGNYVAFMKAFGYPSPNDVPEDGTEYHVGNTIGSSTIVVNIGDGSAFTVNGLEPNVTYYFDVYKYDPSTFTYEPDPAQDSQATNSNEENLRAYPNPFDVSTTIPFVVSQDNAAVQVSIYDAMGREVNVLTTGNFEAGKHEASWDGYDSNGRKVTAGVYIFRVKSDKGLVTGRVSVR